MRTLFALLTVILFTSTAIGQSTAGSKAPPGTIQGGVEDSAGADAPTKERLEN